MTLKQMELLRNWIIAQIQAEIEDREEDEAGYRGTAYQAQKNAAALYNELKKAFEPDVGHAGKSAEAS